MLSYVSTGSFSLIRRASLCRTSLPSPVGSSQLRNRPRIRNPILRKPFESGRDPGATRLDFPATVIVPSLRFSSPEPLPVRKWRFRIWVSSGSRFKRFSVWRNKNEAPLELALSVILEAQLCHEVRPSSTYAGPTRLRGRFERYNQRFGTCFSEIVNRYIFEASRSAECEAVSMKSAVY